MGVDDQAKGASKPQGLTISFRGGAGAGHVSEVFLSSTITDLQDYRREVKEALELEMVQCYLSEGWVNTYGATVQKCKDQFDRADAYIGIFAFWYGSIPPNYDRSITHLEFDWAAAKWHGQQYRPIAVFMPEPDSDAEKDLKKRAGPLIEGRNYKHQDHAALLKSFHEKVTGDWLTITKFRSLNKLCQQVLVACHQWKENRPMRAATGEIEIDDPVENVRTPTPEELGLLGRKKQLQAAEHMISQAARYPEVPAVAMLVYGDEAAGQKEFLEQLKRTKAVSRGRPVRARRPPTEQYDLKGLTTWAGQSLGVLPDGQEVDTTEALADLVYAELHKQQLCLVVDQVNRLLGGVTAFYDTFWKPLYDRLKVLREEKAVANRLITIAADYTGESESWVSVAAEYDEEAEHTDYSRLVLLPKLKPITIAHLYEWFDEVDVPDKPPGRRATLEEIVLNNANKQFDGTPVIVFYKLRNEVLWPEGGEDD